MRVGSRDRRPVHPAADRRLVVAPAVSDDASPFEKEGAARRHLVLITGRCPCGAVLKVPERIDPGTVAIASIEHENGCPALEEPAR